MLHYCIPQYYCTWAAWYRLYTRTVYSHLMSLILIRAYAFWWVQS